MKIIIANGPPFSGKDTFCNLVRDNLKDVDIIPLSYKETLYVGVAARYGLSVKAVFEINADPEVKDVPSALFGGKSVRQALIYESEEVIKKEFGEQGVAIKTFELLKEKYGEERLKQAVLLCSDGGFNSELNAAYDYFDIAVSDVFIARMNRTGCSFNGDSREYLHHPDIHIDNDGTMEDLLTYMPMIQNFVDGYIRVGAPRIHLARDWERKHQIIIDDIRADLLAKRKQPPRPKIVKDRNKGLKTSQTLQTLMSKLNIMTN